MKTWVSHAYNHLCLGVHGPLELLKINSPLRRRRRLGRTILGWVEGNIANSTSRHLNVANISIPSELVYLQFFSQYRGSSLVKEGLEDNDLITILDEAHEGTKHAFFFGHLSAPNVHL